MRPCVAAAASFGLSGVSCAIAPPEKSVANVIRAAVTTSSVTRRMTPAYSWVALSAPFRLIDHLHGHPCMTRLADWLFWICAIEIVLLFFATVAGSRFNGSNGLHRGDRG